LITSDWRLGCSRAAGYEKAHIAIDDAKRLTCVQLLFDEQQKTTAGFLLRAISWFNSQVTTCQWGLSVYCSAYRSNTWREACIAAKADQAIHLENPRQGSVVLKTMLAESVYAMAFQCSTERNLWLSR
jgi:hypothetical protein